MNIKRSNRGSVDDMLQAFQGKLSELGACTDVNAATSEDDQYISALCDAVSAELEDQVDSVVCNQNNDSVDFIITSGEHIQELNVPYEDLSFSDADMNSDVDYIVGAYFDEDAEPVNSAQDAKDVRNQVIKKLAANGYDPDSESVKNYADAAADYLSNDPDYSVDQWYKDTCNNYPEDLDELDTLLS